MAHLIFVAQWDATQPTNIPLTCAMLGPCFTVAPHRTKKAALGALGHGASRLDFFQSVANSDRIGPCSRQPGMLKMLLTTRRFGAQSNLSHIESLEILENPHWLQAYLAELPGLGLSYRTYHSQMKSK